MVEFLKRAPWHVPSARREVRETVSRMLLDIERDGEAAVRRFSRELDAWDPPTFVLEPADLRRGADGLDVALVGHIDFAATQIRRFARAQRDTLLDLEVETMPGTVLGHRHIPVGSVGSYVPGGRYPMLASGLMTVAVAKVAGVSRVIAAAPPRDGRGPDPGMLQALLTAEADVVVCLGGVQALAAMAYGLCGLEPVDMLVGAGNAYVAEAKRQLFGEVGIDLLAGPTEVLVIADDTADPERVAADLLGQAEHGPTSPAMLVTTSRSLGEAALRCVERLLDSWPTAEIAGAAWRDHGSILIAGDDEEAARVTDEHAPEHLEVQVAADKLDWFLDRLRNYGSLFLGAEATVAYGDKAVGTNHVLPTRGAARFTGGLWVGKFLKTCTYQRLTPEGTRAVAPAVAAISRAEGFEGHAITADMRLAAADRS